MFNGRLVNLFVFFLLFPLELHAEGSSKAVIAFAQDTLKNDFRKAQVMAVKDAADRHPQLKFVYSDAQGKTSLLIRQIERFIAQQVEILIVGTNDEQAVVPVISKAHEAGIKVIVLDRGVKTEKYTTFINSDNVEIGAIGGRYIAKALNGKGKVLLFEGIQTADVTQLRSKGFLQEMAGYPEISVIKRTGNYLRKDALVEMEKLLAGGERVDAIFAESDSMLSGVRPVLKKYGIDPASIIMVGCDYTSEARDAIVAGTQTGSVLFPLGGEESVAAALELLAGKELPKHIVNPVKLVTQENVEAVRPIF